LRYFIIKPDKIKCEKIINMPVTPRKAATVAVIRDNSGSVEVLLMKRHSNDAFLPDYYVFPGGTLDEQDYKYEFSRYSRVNAVKSFNDNHDEYYAHVMCAVRETFEESCFLFAVDSSGIFREIKTDESVTRFSRYRRLVYDNKLSFRDMLMDENLLPAVTGLFYLDRWITPEFFPIRFDARFFAAIAPPCQSVSHDNNELVDLQWLNPSLALHRFRAGSIKMVTPTVSTLGLLSRFDTAAGVISYLKNRI
jgi:8-oxo-dGTP pyrophosphatase MutT (NUDIX family)